MKKLSFILALIIALTGMIGLFATPAYAADITPDYVVDGTTYANVGAALEAAAASEKETVYIRVDVDTAEAFNNAPIAKNIVVYSDNATAPTLTATAAAADNVHPIDTSKYGGMFDMNGGSLTLENLNIVTDSDNYCAVYFNTTATGVGTLVINNCSIDTVGRSIHVNAGGTFTDNVNITVNNSSITSGKNILQHNARTTGEATKAVINFNNVEFDASAGGVQVQNVYADINFTNCTVKEGGSLKQLVYSSTKNTVHTLDVVGCDITTTEKTVGYANTANGTNFNFVDSVLKSPKYVVHVAHATTNVTTLGTFNFVNCDLECTSTNYIIALDPASKSGADIKGVVNIYSGTYKTAGKGLMANDADARINIYGGSFISTSTTGFIMGGNTKAYFYGGTIDATLPFAANNAGQQATGIQAITDGTKTTYVPEGITVDTTLLSAKGAQIVNGTTSESASTSIRLVFQIKATEAELANYSAIGVWASKSNSTVMDLGELNAQAKVTVLPTTTTVYTSVNADGVVVEAAEGYYYILVEISNISNANFADLIYVRPYVVAADGTTVTAGDAYVTSVNSFLK